MNIIVDDQDPSLHYTPAWSTKGNDGSPRGNPQEFMGTTSHSVQEDTTVSFTFIGTQITIFGSLLVVDQVTSDAFLQFTLDGIRQDSAFPEVVNPPFHRLVWDSGSLSDGQHILVMEDTIPDTSDFFFDYIIYKTNARELGQTVLIDDDESAVVFSSEWRHNNTFDFMQETSSYTGQAGESVTVQYNFMDGDKLSLFDSAPPLNLPPQNAPPLHQTIFNQKLYTSPALTAGLHTFNFSYNSGTPLGVDYFLVEPSSSFSSDSGGGTSGTTSSPTGLIGGVVASLLLLLISGAIFWLRRRNIQRINQRRAVPLDVEAATVTAQFPLSKRALAAGRETTVDLPVARVENSETNDAGPEPMVSAAALPTDELVRILRSRLGGNVVIAGGRSSHLIIHQRSGAHVRRNLV
ncbi:hypothetical protein MIND_00125000 [Mycena indigotica]|uniref:Uncharacterized protein n=1 Tax=Mycena indigotica TaxID=2126181 RepID=A0A8H6TC48_9AGAR|nr:uncharacterized protein MIND_00125000 [Mycena indigotica]KAF7316070.1 hypothetical protein MIND_00125000 [Mycena indigotica]